MRLSVYLKHLAETGSPTAAVKATLVRDTLKQFHHHRANTLCFHSFQIGFDLH
jgi:hypothetical protein